MFIIASWSFHCKAQWSIIRCCRCCPKMITQPVSRTLASIASKVPVLAPLTPDECKQRDAGCPLHVSPHVITLCELIVSFHLYDICAQHLQWLHGLAIALTNSVKALHQRLLHASHPLVNIPSTTRRPILPQSKHTLYH